MVWSFELPELSKFSYAHRPPPDTPIQFHHLNFKALDLIKIALQNLEYASMLISQLYSPKCKLV